MTFSTEARILIYTERYFERIAWYQKHFDWPVATSWDDGPNKRGIMLNTGSVILEFIEREEAKPLPETILISLKVPNVWKLWDNFQHIETIDFSLRNNSWGDTSFCIKDPEGLSLVFFTETTNNT